MKNNLQKIEAIQGNPKQLKAGESEIEQKRIDDFIQVLRVRKAFQIDFYALVGGILEAIDTIRSEPVKMEAWRIIGKKFLKSSLMLGQKRVKNSCRKMRRNMSKINQQLANSTEVFHESNSQ